MSTRQSVAACIASAALFCVAATSATAMVVVPGVVAGNLSGNTAPIDGRGFNYVGQLGNGSAIYLGNGKILTAKHVSVADNTWGHANQFVLDGLSYNISGGPQLLQPAAGDPDVPDLAIYTLTAKPNLPWLTIRSTQITDGTSVSMVGAGLVASSAEISYPSQGATFFGYDIADDDGSDASRTKVWGMNRVLYTYQDNITGNTAWFPSAPGNGLLFDSTGTGGGISRVLQTSFDRVTVGGLANEAQATNHDSGAGLFSFNAGTNTWELTAMVNGVIQFVAGHASDASNATYLGAPARDRTVAVDLSYYSSQIVAAVPEPATFAVLLAGAPLFMLGRKRR